MTKTFCILQVIYTYIYASLLFCIAINGHCFQGLIECLASFSSIINDFSYVVGVRYYINTVLQHIIIHCLTISRYQQWLE